MGITILIVFALAITGVVVWFFIKNKKEEPSIQSEKLTSQPTHVNEAPKENEPNESKEEEFKPKFKVGDWIIGRATNNEPRQISEITDQCYKSTYGGQYGFSFENEMHLWTIQDAKDGDVIYLPNGNNEYYFFIFKGIENAAVMSFAHFYQYDDGTSEVKGTIDKLSSVNDVFQPATKEQHALLFAKIKEAGYEWDSDKKELKEIKQPEPVLQEPTVNETTRKSFSECLDAFKEYVSIPDGSVAKGFLEDIYTEASYQFRLESYNGLPLLYKKDNFPNVYDIYGDKKDEAAAFNSIMGWMFALLLSTLKPKKRTQILKIGYELGGYNYNSPTFGYEFKSDPNVARLVGSMVLAAMLGKKNPDLKTMSVEVGGTNYPNGLSYYLDQGLNHLKTADDIQKNVVSKSGFYVDFRQFMPSSAGPYDKNFKSRPANIMVDEKDEYLNLQMDRNIHEFIVNTFNLDSTDPVIRQRTIQAIADKEQSMNHLFGSNKKVEQYEFHPVFGKDTIGKKIKTDGAVANLAWNIQAIATYFRLILQNKVDSPVYYGRLRPGCDWTEEKKKNSSTDDHRNILVDITIEDNDGEKESSFGYYNSDGIWVHTQVERDKFAEEQKNHLGANSYPSGHSSGIWCVAMMLAEIMPDKADLIMKEANEFSVNRTVTRFHWTSDTIFGRVLGSVANAMCHATTDYSTLLKIAQKEVEINPVKL